MTRCFHKLVIALCTLLAAFSISAFADTKPDQRAALEKWREANNWSADTSSNIGKSMYGFTRYKWEGKDPRMNGWCKPLDQGSATYWTRFECDANRNNTADSDEVIHMKYWFWYQAKVSVQFAWERTYASGAEWLKTQSDGMSDLKQLAIGDGGCIGVDNFSREVKCCAFKGPLYISASMNLVFDMGSQLYYSHNTSWPLQYSDGVREKEKLTASKDNYLKQIDSVLAGLVSDIVSGSPVGKAQSSQPATPAGTKQSPTAQPAKGTPGLELTVTPAALWADGASKSKIKLVARDANGLPIKGEFPVEVSRGKCSHFKLITDSNGTATADYTAPESPGEDRIIVSGPNGESASVTISLGGIRITQPDSDMAALFADGKSKLDLIVTCGDPSFKPLGGLKVKLFVDEKELPAKGKLSGESVVAGSDGMAEFSYTSPDVYSSRTDFRMGDAHITAVASVGNPARTVKSYFRIPLYAGEVYFLTAVKSGFSRIEKFAVPAPDQNGEISGKIVMDSSDGKSTPVCFAHLSISNPKGETLGEGKSDDKGEFKFQFVGNRLSSTGQKMELSEPLKMSIDEDMSRITSEWGKDLATLEKNGYDVRFLKEFAADLPANLCASAENCKDPIGNTEYLAYTSVRLLYMTRFINLLDQRQEESIDWFLESMKNTIGIMADFAKVSDKIQERAKVKLKDRFAGDSWNRFQEHALTQFASIFYAQFQKAADTAKSLNYNTELPESFKGFGVDYILKQGVDAFAGVVKSGFSAAARKSSQTILTQAGGNALRGQISRSDLDNVIPAAKELFTSYEERHNKLNTANLDRELYRLDVKLFTDSVIKGPFIYANLKKLASDPDIMAKIADMDVASLENIQDAINDAAGPVDKVFNAVDLMFQSYQGYNWIVDYLDASKVKQKLAEMFL